MGKGDIYLTRGGYEKLVKQLDYLRLVRKKEISKATAEAIAQGDLKENAGYAAAKEAQAMNQKKIAELQSKLTRARLIEEEDIASDEALIGATVKLKNIDDGAEVRYTLVSGEEADFETGKISVESPVGDALLGHKENDKVEINIPAGKLKYKVIKISRE